MSVYGFPGGSTVKNLPASSGDTGDGHSVPASGRSPGGSNGNPLQYSCLENPTDRGAWQATIHGVAKSQTQLSTYALECRSQSNSKSSCSSQDAMNININRTQCLPLPD